MPALDRCLVLSFLCLFCLDSSVASAATVLRGFPVSLDGLAEQAPPIAFDIDDDGRLELIIGTRNAIHVLEADGNPVAGFPFKLQKQAPLASALCAGILPGADGSEKRVILFGLADKHLTALDSNGHPLPGFPVLLPAQMAAVPSLVDLDGDGGRDIVFGTVDGRIHALNAVGQELKGYPAQSSDPISTAVTVGRFQPSAEPVLFFGDEAGRLHAWAAPGMERPGFPVRAKYAISSQPVLGDIDDDGSFEVIFGSKDFKVYAVNQDGSMVEGFPVATAYRIYSTPALADVDGDGVVDIVVTSGDGKLYVIGRGGKILKGFPVSAGKRLRASPVVGDVDHDGRVEIGVGTDKNRFVLYRNNGKIYPGFPVRMKDRVDVAPLLVDLNSDGLVEAVALSRNGSLAVFRMIKKGKAGGPLVWPAEGRDAQRRASTYPNPPRYHGLTLMPATPKTTQALQLDYRFFDLDGDSEPKTKIQWFRNDKAVPGFTGAREIPASATRKHERWHFSLQAAAGAPVFKSSTVQVVNTPPGPPEVHILPELARTKHNLKMKIIREALDDDGDKISYRINWLQNRRPVKGLQKAAVWSKRTKFGELWTVVVTPNDGEVDGEAARASKEIANTVPTAAKIRLVPEQPLVTQAVRVEIEKPGFDEDQDPVTYRYHWAANGKALNLPIQTDSMPAGMVSKHGKIELEITSFDGKDEGGKSKAKAQVINARAAAPKIKIVPDSPKTTDDLAVEIVQAAHDPDQDLLRYRVTWTQGAKTAAIESFRLLSSKTRKGQSWKVTVVPEDGEAKGAAAVAEVTIGNTPPTGPEMVAVKTRALTTENLVVKLKQPASDPDGDPITQEVIWYQGSAGKKQAVELVRGPDLFQLPAPRTKKNMLYQAKLVPSDGEAKGSPVSQWFEVVNTPPPGCKVEIQPPAPKTGQAMIAKASPLAKDADGDTLGMRFRWWQDDRPVKSAKKKDRIEGSRVRRAQRWTVEAIPFDDAMDGPACRDSVLVINSPPIPPRISLEPAAPTATDPLTGKILSPARDPDGDELHLRFIWQVDGKQVLAGSKTRSLPAGMLSKGQRWQLWVVVSDGELEGKSEAATCLVANSAPATTNLAIYPSAPLSSEDLHCRLLAATEDPDGDAVKHSYEWFLVKNEKEMPQGKPKHLGAILPAAQTRKGQQWLCRATASDGHAAGRPGLIRVRVANAAPTPPVLELQPPQPKPADTLRCVVKQAATDPDQDQVQYQFEWTKDGVKQSFASHTDNVPSRLTKANDIWQCSAKASDGAKQSLRAESNELLIRAAGKK